MAGGLDRAGLDKRAARRRRLADRGMMVAAILGVSIPVFLLAAVLLYLFAFKLPWFPNTGYVHVAGQSRTVGLSPVPALDLDRDPVDRLLLPGAALQPARHGQPGLRAHGPGQGPDAAAGVQPPRAAQLADADRHDVRAGLRRAAGRRRAGHRDRVQPPRDRAVRGAGDRATSTCRRSWWARCSPPSSWCCSARSPTSCTPLLDPRVRLTG